MVMTNLPDYVSESQAEEIFRIADRDGNGYISYTEFKASRSYIMIATAAIAATASAAAAAMLRGLMMLLLMLLALLMLI